MVAVPGHAFHVGKDHLSLARLTTVHGRCIFKFMNTHEQSKPKRNVTVSGISFAPHVWDQLQREVEQQGHRNRSLVVEKALTEYFARQAQRRQEVETALLQKLGSR